MKQYRNCVVILLCLSACSMPVRKTAIDADLLSQIRTVDVSLPALNSDLRDYECNYPSDYSIDTSCTYRVPIKRVTNQGKSGRCWLFSTLNMLRAEVITEQGWDDFQFSQNYCQFWDLLEKCNRSLEDIVRYRHEPLDSRMNEWIFKKPFGDGGQFSNSAHLIDKYGLVPFEVMPDQFNSTDNVSLMNELRWLVRKYGLELRLATTERDISTIKTTALTEAYRLLVSTLGFPPSTFEWAGVEYTPISFRDTFVHHDMEKDYACMMNDPTRPYYKMYAVLSNRNCEEYPDWTFLNVPMEVIDSLGVKCLKAGKMFVFSADTEHDHMQSQGWYSVDNYNRIVDLSMNKNELLQSCEIRSVHAIAMEGVFLDKTGRPARWLVENSYGEGRGVDGHVVMTAEWLDKYLLRAVFEKNLVPESLLRIMNQKPKEIPAWNPTY